MATRRIPSLNWLRVFEAAAQSQSFARASEALNMSAPAVSQQVKALEGHLGRPLFERGPRSVTLTRTGRAFLPVVQQALRSVETTAAALFGNPSGEPLTVQASLMFACSWLAPRLTGVQDRHPDVQLQVLTANQPEDYLRAAADLQVVFGAGPEWAGEHDPLFGESLYPVALPQLASRIETAADLLDHRLVEIATHRSGWLQVLDAAGAGDLARARFCFADTTQLSLAMAASGFGLALARAPATDPLVACLGLVPCLANLRVAGSQSYALVRPPTGVPSRAATRFRAWLLEETASER